jgi:magnesium chelatase subunit I
VAQQSALLRLLSEYSYKRITELPEPDLGLANYRPFPFLAVVGQYEMKLALMLSAINPAIGGVLLVGPRGTGKTTAVRSLTTILPHVEVSDCEEGVLPADLEAVSPDEAQSLYPDCYEKYRRGEPISHMDAVRLVELPLNARVEDVVGGINERVAMHRNLVRVERGLLNRADNNILYVDEVNLLDDEIVDLILDAAAQGSYTVRRGAVAGTYRARFVLIGSMNPEEGRLRPQILDRFGLRVVVAGVADEQERAEIYWRARSYRLNPSRFVREWEAATHHAQEELTIARAILPDVTIDHEVVSAGVRWVNALGIDSHRAEYTLFETARAYCAADLRTTVTPDDLLAVALLALRMRRSEFMDGYVQRQQQEDHQIKSVLDVV